VKEQADDRSSLALGLEWSSRITTVALEMVVPALIGYWIDLKLGTRLVFLILGTALGFVTGLMSLLRMTRSAKPNRERDDG
jgi:ATP synthase protein I